MKTDIKVKKLKAIFYTSSVSIVFMFCLLHGSILASLTDETYLLSCHFKPVRLSSMKHTASKKKFDFHFHCIQKTTNTFSNFCVLQNKEMQTRYDMRVNNDKISFLGVLVFFL